MTFSFDFFSRSRKELIAYFEYFGEVECPQIDGEIYRELCRVVRNDETLLEIAAQASPNQPPANLLFGAVHSLLLAGEAHSLREWYPALSGGETKATNSIGPAFKEFCSLHRPRIEELMRTRLTQTNVVQRCTALLPAFGRVLGEAGGQPLSLIEIGPSAGLNLQWDRFFYRYADGRSWGDSSSRVVVECALRGNVGLPDIPESIPVTWRRGVDLNPVDLEDPDQMLWLRSLIWPDHVGRQERLTAAIEIARENPPQIVVGVAWAELPPLLAAPPHHTTLCVYGTHTLYQFPREARVATLKAMQAASRQRTVHFLGMEGTGQDFSELRWTVYKDGERSTRVLARCNPHGRWLEWLG
jgi:hypothetical protein